MVHRLSAISTVGLVALALIATAEVRAQAGPQGFSDSQMVQWPAQPWAHPDISMGEWPWGEQFYDRDAWAWVPSAGELAGMTEEELLAIRARAQAQIAGAPGSEKGGVR